MWFDVLLFISADMSFWGLQNSLAVKYVLLYGVHAHAPLQRIHCCLCNVVMFHSGVFGIADKGFD
ncbi:hypothetical protein FG476_10340 [Xylella fastidiosa subsp. multiplex]|uniref:Uncharacterized protein n=2 Tax=Xylella fastidiosa TaxID=2371 RepID=A0A9Q4MK71_XYLFS|nr:hypothetical protein [Xylella fastidiosa]ACA11717.1 hypothetical protein Xfasm12_0723 [Xylella fastidiosa M12]KFA41178.1 hypothetical protein DF22_002342 [Xylella fastidiosa]MCH7233376.1 hypothetical protein [Xylella fastidiosa subsp. multiplex]MDD0860192.1 hypothetical protein [Xylella fastidiosa subsp. multiplex]MDD0869137.1 hypothetical protein [Xylella fastidiosa subsp. multiplex]